MAANEKGLPFPTRSLGCTIGIGRHMGWWFAKSSMAARKRRKRVLIVCLQLFLPLQHFWINSNQRWPRKVTFEGMRLVFTAGRRVFVPRRKFLFNSNAVKGVIIEA